MTNRVQRIKLYFNADKICLGGVADDWWQKDFDGDYWVGFGLLLAPRGLQSDWKTWRRAFSI